MGSKLFVSYKIENIIEGIVKIGDELKGKVFIRSETQGCRSYNCRALLLKDHDILDASTKVEPEETTEFDFMIKLPSILGPKNWGWHITLSLYNKG